MKISDLTEKTCEVGREKVRRKNIEEKLPQLTCKVSSNKTHITIAFKRNILDNTPESKTYIFRQIIPLSS